MEDRKQDDIFSEDYKQEELFKDYSHLNYEEKPKFDKRKAGKIVIVSIIVLMLMAGAFIGGIFTGKSSGIESDMPLLVEAYTMLKKYYYEDIDWETFQETAAQAVMGSVDNFTGMYAYDYTTGSMALGVTISTDTYHNHILSYIIPTSPAANAVAGYSYSDTSYNDKTDITASNIKLNFGDKVYAVSVNGLSPTVVEGANSSLFTSLVSLSNTITLYVVRSDGTGGYLDGLYEFTMTKAYVASTSAYYYDSSEIGDTTETTGMIKLLNFTGTAISDFSNCVDSFVDDGYSNLILDLRGNGGGDAAILSYIAGCLVKGANTSTTNIAYYKYNSGSGKYSDMYFTTETSATVTDDEGNEKTYNAKNLPALVNDFKITILCDGGSASCSEVLIGAMQYYNDTTIIGSTTYGKGVAQTVRSIGNGKYYVVITNGKYYIPTEGDDGNVEWTTCIHGVGFTPSGDNKIATSYRPYTSDKCIQRALSILG